MPSPNIEVNSNDMWECRDCKADLGSSRVEALKHTCCTAHNCYCGADPPCWDKTTRRIRALEGALRLIIRESEYNRTGNVPSDERIQEQLEWWVRLTESSVPGKRHG